VRTNSVILIVYWSVHVKHILVGEEITLGGFQD